jgi:hypothetical protein
VSPVSPFPTDPATDDNIPDWITGLDDPVEDVFSGPSAQPPSDDMVRRAVAGDRPTVSPTPDLTVMLPRGYSLNGVEHTQCEVRELTGADEEYLGRFKTDEAIFDGVISMGVTKLGAIDLAAEPLSERSRVLGTLLVGERLMIYLKIVEATFGDDKEMRFTCGHCQTEQDTTVLISEDFKVIFPDDLQMVHEFKISSGDVVRYRLVTGADVLELSESKAKTRAEINTSMLARLVVAVNDEPLLDPESTVRKFSIGDRERLLKDLVDHQPDVSLSLKINCIACHEEVTIPIDWGQLFRA